MPLHPLATLSAAPGDFLRYCMTLTNARLENAPKDFDEQGNIKILSPPDTIIICHSEQEFINELLLDIKQLVPQEFTNNDIDHYDASQMNDAQRLLFFTPVGAILASENISVVYCPTLHHLRAYIVSLTTNQGADAFPPVEWEEGTVPPFLGIYGLLPMHYDSTEWSSQGIARTLASIVTAGNKIDRQILIEVPYASTFGLNTELPLVNTRLMKGREKKKKRPMSFYGGEGFEKEEEEEEPELKGKVRHVIERWCQVVEIDELLGEKIVEYDGERGVPCTQDMLF